MPDEAQVRGVRRPSYRAAVAAAKERIVRALAAAGLPRVALTLGAGRLRILEYHGICPDEVAGAAWTPAHFVTRSRFEAQMDFVARHLRPMRIVEAVAGLADGTLPRGAVCVTFDDGYANNLHLALPVLRRYGVPATIHLATHYVECGDFYPFDRIRLAGRPEATYKDRTIDACLADAASWWPKVRARLTREQVVTLRPLRRDELALFDRSLVDFGAHTHTHCILSHETRERRRAEIRRSVELVREWTGGAPSFSYPNGRAGDFDGRDKDALRELGVCAALSCGRHANPPGADLLELGRYPVGLHHDAAAFRFELSGLRALLARRRPVRPHARVAVRTPREPARVAGAPVPIPNGTATRASPSLGDHR